MKYLKDKRSVKYAIIALEVLGLLMVAYILIAPLEPLAQYELFGKKRKEIQTQNNFLPPSEASAQPGSTTVAEKLKDVDLALKGDRLIIPKIGVNAYISKLLDSKKGLNEGMWLDPDASRPDLGSNTVISGHRWKYLPPNNTTLYLLDKMSVGDDMHVRWKDKIYSYKIKEIKVVKPADIYILDPSDKPILTVYTCTPLYSQKNRLVVIGELVP